MNTQRQRDLKTGSYPALATLRVIDAMHPALITCSPDSSLRTIARMMATYRVHAILVTAHGDEELAGEATGGSFPTPTFCARPRAETSTSRRRARLPLSQSSRSRAARRSAKQRS